jgi:hypothetical protein
VEPFAIVPFVPLKGDWPPWVAVAVGRAVAVAVARARVVAVAVGRAVDVGVGPLDAKRTEFTLKSPPFTTSRRRMRFVPPVMATPPIDASA